MKTYAIQSILTSVTILAAIGLAGVATAGEASQYGFGPLINTGEGKEPYGRIEMMWNPIKMKSRLAFHARHLDTTLEYKVWLETGSASSNMQKVGIMKLTDSCGPDTFELVFDSEEGQDIPFGVDSVLELVDADVEIRSSGVAFLTGRVPPVHLATGVGMASAAPKSAFALTRPADAPAGKAKGVIELKAFEDSSGRLRLTLDEMPDGEFTLWLDDEPSPTVENMVKAAQLDAASDGEVQYWLQTKHGDLLPLCFDSVWQMESRKVEIRRNGKVFLHGMTPSLDDGYEKGKATLASTSGEGSGVVKLSSKPDVPKQVFEASLDGLPADITVALRMQHPITLAMETIAELHTNAKGKAKFAIETNSGAPLPHGVLTVEQLDGLQVEVRRLDTSDLLLVGMTEAP